LSKTEKKEFKPMLKSELELNFDPRPRMNKKKQFGKPPQALFSLKF
jgi:hypothetical protein